MPQARDVVSVLNVSCLETVSRRFLERLGLVSVLKIECLVSSWSWEFGKMECLGLLTSMWPLNSDHTSAHLLRGWINCHHEMNNFISYSVARLAGCEHIRRVRFHHCAYVDDEALHAMVQRLKDSLQRLELSSCDISDAGLRHITQLQYVFHLLTFFICIVLYFNYSMANDLSHLWTAS